MDKIDPQIKITQIDDSTKIKIFGNDINGAPQSSIDAPTGTTTVAVGVTGTYTAGGTYSTNEKNLINNHTNQILQIEAALVKLGLLKSR